MTNAVEQLKKLAEARGTIESLRNPNACDAAIGRAYGDFYNKTFNTDFEKLARDVEKLVEALGDARSFIGSEFTDDDSDAVVVTDKINKTLEAWENE